MKKITLVTFLQESCSTKEKTFTRFLIKKIPRMFKRKKVEDFYKEYELCEGLIMSVIELPYSYDELMQKKGPNATKLVSWVCACRRIECCIIPEKLNSMEKLHCLDKIKLISYKGDILFKTLTVEIMMGLKGDAKGKIYSYDVSIVKGSSKEELFNLVRRISPLVKYLNIFTLSKDAIEDEVNSIYEESGLSIGITSDCSNAFKNSDIIVNLGDLTEMNRRLRVKKGALIINYGNMDRAFIRDDCIIVNGIDVSMPASLMQKVPQTVFTSFSMLEITEIIICSRLQIQNKITGKPLDVNSVENISKEFREGRYSISRFQG